MAAIMPYPLAAGALGNPEAYVSEAVLLRPAFNQAFYYSNPETDIAVLLTTQPADAERRDLVMRLSLRGMKDEDLGSREVRDVVGRRTIISLAKPALRDGDQVKVIFEVRHEARTLVEREWILTQMPPNRDEVVMRDDGVTLVNGKPFFPIGMFQSPVSEFTAMKKMGFNVVHTYQTADSAYMKAAEEARLYVISDVKGIQYQTERQLYHELAGWNEPELIGSMESLKRSPALLAYYMYDEPSPKHTPRELLRKLCDVPRRVDPYHLVAGCNNEHQRSYGDVADAMIIDSYPVPGPMTGLIRRVAAGAAAQLPRQAIWFMPQAFSWEPYFRMDVKHDGAGNPIPEGGRTPTFDEVRTMPWIAFALGAKGFTYYSWQTQNFYIRDAYPIFWTAFVHHVNETVALFPWLLERQPEDPPCSSDPRVHVTARRRGDDLFIVAANSGQEPVAARITVPGLAGRILHVISENQTVQSVGNDVEASFLGMETHLYTTLASSAPDLPTLAEIRAEQSRLRADFESQYPSFSTYRDGATLDASWGFPEPAGVSWASWYRMIDGQPNTPWTVGQAFRSHEIKGWDQKDFSSPGRWIEVRLPAVRQINMLRAIVSPDAEFELCILADGAWQKVEGQVVRDVPPRHFRLASATTTARFPTVRSDRFRIVFLAPKEQEEAIFELSAAVL